MRAAGPTNTLLNLEIGEKLVVPLTERQRWWAARDRAVDRYNLNISWEKTDEGYVLCRVR